MSKDPSKLRKKLLYIFLEGKTEDIFYKKITEIYLKPFPKKYYNLRTGTNVNLQIVRQLYNFLKDTANLEYDLYVYAFIDREGTRDDPSPFDGMAIINKLKEQINTDNIKVIDDIEAIYMIESWFFYDLEGICNYIDIQYTTSLRKRYSNPERYTYTDLSELFKKGNSKKRYNKGDKSFLNNLNIEKIYNSCSDLKNGIQGIIQKFNS